MSGRAFGFILARRGLSAFRIVKMARKTRLMTWNGKDVPAEFGDLPRVPSVASGAPPEE